MRRGERKISLRVPATLYTSLKEQAERHNVSLSDLMRTILANGCYPQDEAWKLKIWKIFGVNLVKVEWALKKSATVGEFLSYLDQYSKVVSITPNISKHHDFDFTINERVFNITAKKKAFTKDIANIINELDKKILDSYEEDL